LSCSPPLCPLRLLFQAASIISMSESAKLVAPAKIEFLRELMAIKDLISLLHPRTKRIIPEYAKNSKHVVMFPGFGTDTRYFKPLNKYLERHGHFLYDWGLGLNDAGLKRECALQDIGSSWQSDPAGKAAPINSKELGIPYLCTRSVERVRSLSLTIESPLVLVGWSLGGYIAREVARELPNEVSQVVTFGTPIIGGAKYTATADSFRKNGIDLDWIEREIAKREHTPITQAITGIIGAYDGIIARSACEDINSPNVSIREVKTCHMGLGFHYPLWRIVLEALARD
jgi:pimeloyl-ACP methyl ester carboxylesterase